MFASRVIIAIVLLAPAASLGSVAGRAEPGESTAGAVAGAPSLALREPLAFNDPFPLLRLRIEEDQVPAAIRQLDLGTLVRLPRSEFEARVKRSARADAERKAVPRIVEAKYSATFTGGDLSGDVEWTILNPKDRPGVLSLDPLRVAVHSAQWLGGGTGEATLGAFGPGFAEGQCLWVPGGGRRVLRARWSAAGSGKPGEHLFDLRLPPSPAASLDLHLPTDLVPVLVSSDALLTGPLAAEGQAGQKTWRLRFGDRSRLEFGIRGPGDPSAAGSVLATLAARYEAAPGQLTCSFEYDLRPTRGPVSEWLFDLPPELQVTNTVANNRAGWQVDPESHVLRIQLRQPGMGGKVLVTGVAPLSAPNKPMLLPMIRPRGSIIGDEKIELRIQPELKVGVIDDGDFRVIDSGIATDRSRSVILSGTFQRPGPRAKFRQPPSIRLSGSDAAFVTTEAVEWRVEGQWVYLGIGLNVQVRRGPLFRLDLKTPPGFRLDRAVATPGELITHTGPTPGTRPGVGIEFSQPLTSGQSADLRLEFRGPDLSARSVGRFAFPEVVPVGAVERDGWVSIVPGPEWTAVVRTALPQKPTPPGRVPLPSPPTTAAATFYFSGKPPEGTLIVTPVQAVFDVEPEVQIGLSSVGPTATYRNRLKVRSGALASLFLVEPRQAEGEPDSWRVRPGSNAVASVGPLLDTWVPAAAAVAGTGAAGWPGLIPAASVGTAPRSQMLREIRFARPITGELVLETVRTVGPLQLRERPELIDRTTFLVPLIEIVGGHHSEVRTSIEGGLADRVSGGLVVGNSGDYPARQYIRVEPKSGTEGRWSFQDLHHITACNLPRAAIVFGGTIAARGGSVLTVTLPRGAEEVAVLVSGNQVDSAGTRAINGSDGVTLDIPLPAGNGPQPFEVRYRLAAEGEAFWGRIASPVPLLPGGPVAVKRWWLSSDEGLPAWPFDLRDWASSDEVPPWAYTSIDPEFPGTTAISYSGESVFAVPARFVDAAGFGLTAAIAALAWLGSLRSPRGGGAMLILSLLAAGCMMWLGPEAWQRAAKPVVVVSLFGLAAVAIANGWRKAGVAPRPRPGSQSSISQIGTAAIAALVVLLAMPLFGTRAETPAHDIVFILRGPADSPDRESVLAPQTVLDRLDALTRTSGPGSVVTAASYDGRAEDGFARFDAVFQVHCFRDGDNAVTLPLDDIRLEQMTVNGKPASPVVDGADLYTVHIADSGRHEVKATFTVPLSNAGPERSLKFGIPEVPDTRLSFSAPAGSGLLQAVGRYGKQWTSADSESARLEAQVGSIKTAEVRWRQGTGGAAVASVREGCVWDVAEAGAVLTACYQVRVESGVATGFRFKVPDQLEPVRATVRSLEATTEPQLIRDWTITQDNKLGRILGIDLIAPADGRILVTLECRIAGVPGRRPTLPFPQPIGMDRRGGVYGLRATGVAIESVGRTGVIDFAADALIREFGSVPDLRLNPAVNVLAFSPRLDQAAELRPTLVLLAHPPAATQKILWRVGPTRADGTGTIRWNGLEPVPVLEFSLPGVPLAEVRGADVESWSQSGNRVQVWFRKPVREAAVEWFATRDSGPGRKAPTGPFVFEPPVPALGNLRTEEQTLEVLPADGWGIKVIRDRGWTVSPPDEDRSWQFESAGTAPPVQLQFFGPQRAAARGFGLVDTSGNNWSYRVAVESPLVPGRPAHLVLRLGGLPPGSTAALELPPGTTATDRSESATERSWDLDIAASPDRVFRAAVIARFPVHGYNPLPEVWCGPGNAAARPGGIVQWIVLPRDPALRLEGGNRTAADAAAIRATWPGEVERLRRTNGTLWLVVEAPAAVVATPTAAPVKPSPAETPAPVPQEDSVEKTSAGPWSRTELYAAIWCATVLVLGLLFVTLPGRTWPEQIGILGGLFGFAVAGGPVVGAAALVAARLTWLIGRAKR